MPSALFNPEILLVCYNHIIPSAFLKLFDAFYNHVMPSALFFNPEDIIMQNKKPIPPPSSHLMIYQK